jgi:hypothetical protein
MKRRFPILLAVAATVSSGACREAPTAPEATIGRAPQPPALTSESAAAFAAALEDGRLRIMPGLGDTPVVERLRYALDALSGALDGRDGRALDEALRRTRAAVDALDDRGVEAAAAMAPDLDAVRLILAVAQTLLDPASASPGRQVMARGRGRTP